MKPGRDSRVHFSGMASRHGLFVYSLLLALAACAWLVGGLAAPGPGGLPALWIAALCACACLVVWTFGLPAPRVGLTSMERLPQIALLLILGTPAAATICALASLAWPFLSPSYRQSSMRGAMIRGLHNFGMTALMLLAAGSAYTLAGGRWPLTGFTSGDIVPLLVMAVTAQAVNVALLALYFWLDGRDVRRLVLPIYSLIDLLVVPTGVLAAVLYHSASAPVFWVYIAVMALFLLSFNGIGRTLGDSEGDNAPLARIAATHRALHGARGADDVGNRVLAEARALFRFDEFYLALADQERHVLDLRVHERRHERQPIRQKPIGSGLLGSVVQSGSPVLVENWARAPADLRERAEVTEKETGSIIAVPLVDGNSVVGVLSIQHTRPRVYSDGDLHLLEKLAEQVAPAIADALAFEDLENYRRRLEERVVERTRELEKLNEDKERLITALGERSRTLERQSQEDALTGIANRRAFNERLEAEVELATAVSGPLTLAVADLDHFKVVNDELGHAVGDEVLRQSATIMRRLCRSTDLVARIGGEEFALILPGMSREVALGACEAMRHAVESHDWATLHPGLQVTLSIGLAQWEPGADSEDLLQAADIQLYRAKRTGRNRVA